MTTLKLLKEWVQNISKVTPRSKDKFDASVKRRKYVRPSRKDVKDYMTGFEKSLKKGAYSNQSINY